MRRKQKRRYVIVVGTATGNSTLTPADQRGVDIDGSGQVEAYDHDFVSQEDLSNLLGGDMLPSSTPPKSLRSAHDQPQQTAEPAWEPIPVALVASEVLDPLWVDDDLPSRPVNGHPGAVAMRVERPDDRFEERLVLLASYDVPSESVDLDLDSSVFDVPDIDEGVGAEEDLIPEITDGRRARQLALAFLLRMGEQPKNANLEKISDIILVRRWSAAQLQVQALLEAGFSLDEVFGAFTLSEEWRQSDALDEQIGVKAGLNGYCNPRLTWLESARLYRTFESTEVAFHFVESERYIWRDNAWLRHKFPHFKDYLLKQRLSEETRADNGWIRNLPSNDPRLFGGASNPEYSEDWWEDQCPSLESRSAIDLMLYRGGSVESLVPDYEEDYSWADL